MDLHPQLKRFLRKIRFSYEEDFAPNENLKKFIELINRSYFDFDQERYLLERSMEISIKEMESINKLLEDSQHIADMSYWKYDINKDKMYWSTEFSYLMGKNESYLYYPSLEEFIQLVHDEDKINLFQLIEDTKRFNKRSELEIRIKQENKEYRWFKMISRAHSQGEDNIDYLSGVVLDITNQKVREIEIQSLNNQLLAAVEKSDLSTGIANTMLNSVSNVLDKFLDSISIIKQNYLNSYLPNLILIKDAVSENQANLPQYLTLDEKGKLLPNYLISTIEEASRCHSIVYENIYVLDSSVQHIQDIIAMGRTISGNSEGRERYFLPELIDNAIYMSDIEFMKEKKIQVEKKFNFTPFLMTDKSKLLQILIHLIQNATSALIEDRLNLHKKIEISVNEGKQDRLVAIVVQDNGIGISQDIIDKIFLPGFTTKKNGKGSSLYSCVLGAKELGGELYAHSEGEGKGASFNILLPLE